MKRIKFVIFAFAAVFTFGLSTGCTPSPEDLCKKVEKEEDKKECTKEMEDLKKTIGDDNWKTFAKCADGKDKIDEKVFEDCIGDMMKKK